MPGECQQVGLRRLAMPDPVGLAAVPGCTNHWGLPTRLCKGHKDRSNYRRLHSSKDRSPDRTPRRARGDQTA
jgi:hypothetical protein